MLYGLRIFCSDRSSDLYRSERVHDEDEDKPLMRCFAKEYPEMSIEEMYEKMEKLSDKYRELEDKYSTLDADGDEKIFEFCMPDECIFTMEELSNIFDEIVHIFEGN